ncbi:MAG: 4Fe-4S binding protein [Christensenellales bacterium]
MQRIIQRTLQILFLALFIALAALGKVQLWMGVFAAGVALSFFFGRVYCGWACPIGTATAGVTFLKKKLRIKNIRTPAFLKKPFIRYFVLAAFVAVFALTMVQGLKAPVLPILFGAGVLAAAFFHEELWHRCLCPYGTILQLTSTLSKRGMKIDGALCTDCGKCVRVCPSGAAVKKERHTIVQNECLVCRDCVQSCPKEAVRYGKA